MSAASGATPSGASASNVSTVAVAGSFLSSTQIRDGANQPSSYSINRYVYDTQARPVTDRTDSWIKKASMIPICLYTPLSFEIPFNRLISAELEFSKFI
ncbi:hypothetical protein FOBRF1_016378 [Fusarium oxysporum]